jgi:hypothetical protein
MPEPIDVYLPADPDDPRSHEPDPPGVVVHRGPPLHPDDVTVVDGVPVTSPSRTLIDLAEVLDEDELRECFERARGLGLLDPEALRASRERVEWRPSLVLVDRLIDELCPGGTQLD